LSQVLATTVASLVTCPVTALSVAAGEGEEDMVGVVVVGAQIVSVTTAVRGVTCRETARTVAVGAVAGEGVAVEGVAVDHQGTATTAESPDTCPETARIRETTDVGVEEEEEEGGGVEVEEEEHVTSKC